VIDTWEAALGPEHPEVAAVLNDLGVAYLNEGRFTDAEEQFWRALSICEKSLVQNHRCAAASLNNRDRPK
jgi:hypothetical protein